jgi:hypothetical protein
MATVYKIHPAIGIARVGNSPDEFFIGPERLGEHPSPAGGFKDGQCRVKRQAARFRIYAHHDDGTVDEITDAEADISWTVHLVNQKAAHPGRGNTEGAGALTIDPGSRTLNGPNQRKLFDTGTIDFADADPVIVPLGEVRSDDANHLLVLGGFGKSASPPGSGLAHYWTNDDWYDDVSDGPVSATITIRATGTSPLVVGAWVIVAPPKFATGIDNVITLYDRVFQAMVDAGMVAEPTTTSYTNDVFPILQRARDTRWVESIGSVHSWADPVTSQAVRDHIFNRLSVPGSGGSDMPDLNDSGTGDNRLTPTQYHHMERWKNGNYTNDWVGVPAPQANITPDGLDRAALDNCVGGAFLPGIEAGGMPGNARPIIDATKYLEAFRLNHANIGPGGITYEMALPWQADFNACGDNWWPVPRPNDVIPQGQSTAVKWSRNVGGYEDMVAKWHSLGFIIPQGSQHVEVDRCDTATITLLTPNLNFHDVPQGPMAMVRETALAITFEVISPGAAVTLEYAPGGAPAHAQLIAFNASVTVGPTAANAVATARLWVIFRTGAIGAIPTQTVTVQHAATSQQWTITIDGSTVARKTAAAALVLDRSGSMAQDRGDGVSKHVSLQQAAAIFVDVMLEGDGVGLVRYNEDAQPLQSILALGAGGLSDVNRSATKDLINGNGLDPLGATSIGDGIFEGRAILNAATTPYDVNALVVMTDGIENRSRFIADVAPQINEATYALGLGTPQNTSAAALQTISGNNGGFLLITGAIGTDNRFLLQKYFLQILAGISNADVVLDPEGELSPGRVHRIPFQLTGADTGVDVILLTPYTQIVDFRVQTPSGLIIEPWRAMSEPGMRYVLSTGVSYYRIVLPVELQADRFDQGGTWQALLTIGRPRVDRTPDAPDGVDRSILHRIDARPTREQASLRRRAGSERHALLASHAAPQAGAPATAAAIPSVGAVQLRTLPYSIIVHTYSNVSLRARSDQSSYEPGAPVSLMATLAQSGLPMARGSQVWAEVTRPNGTRPMLTLAEHDDGDFSAVFVTTVPGTYHFRVRARGVTPRGEPFTRERSVTAAVWRGGDRDADPDRGGRVIVDYLRERDERLCELLACLTRRGGGIGEDLERRLRESGLDLDQLRKCLGLFCRKRETQDPSADV